MLSIIYFYQIKETGNKKRLIIITMLLTSMKVHSWWGWDSVKSVPGGARDLAVGAKDWAFGGATKTLQEQV